MWAIDFNELIKPAEVLLSYTCVERQFTFCNTAVVI